MADIPRKKSLTDTGFDFNTVTDWVNTAESLGRNAGYNTVGKFSTIRTVTKEVSQITDMIPATSRDERANRSSPDLKSNFRNYDTKFRNSTDKLTQDLNQQTGGKSGVINAQGKDVTSMLGGSAGDFEGVSYDADKEDNGKAKNASTSLSANLAMIPKTFNDLNTQYVAPLTTAFDSGRNKFQDLVNGTLAKVDPRLEAAVAVGYAAATNPAGLKSLTKRSGSLATLTGVLTGKLDSVSAAQKIGQLVSPEKRSINTSITNVLKPFSETTRDISRKLNNPIDSIGKATGTDTRGIKLGIGLAKELGFGGDDARSENSAGLGGQAREYNTVFRNINNFGQPSADQDPRLIQNVIGSKNAALVAAGVSSTENPVQNLSVLGKSAADAYTLDTAKVYDQTQKEVSTFSGGSFDQTNDRIVELVAQRDDEQLKPFEQTRGVPKDEVETLVSTGQPKKQGRDGSTKLGNQLRSYSSYNYIITLGILNSEEYNFPKKTLGQKGLSKIILRSGGGEYEKRITTAEEDTLGGHAEYFIDDLELDVVIAPSQNTGIGVGTNISFTVMEPYSMGKFLETLKLAAEELGYSNFSKVPFCLRIDFTGYDEYGRVVENNKVASRYFPIMINNIGFDVGASGSTYDVSAVIYNDVAHEDGVNSIKTDISSAGSIVHEALENSINSVTRNINEHIETLENEKKISGYDRYVIIFPKDKTGLTRALESQGVTEPRVNEVDPADEERKRLGLAEKPKLDDPDTVTVSKNPFGTADPKIYKAIKKWASNKNNINELGLSPLAVDTNQGKGAKHPDAATVYDSENQVNNRSANEASPPQKSAQFQYKQGTKVTEIIEDILLSSQYAQNSLEEDRKDGTKKWFKIETQVYIETDEKVEKSIGRPRMTYVYSVIPYFPDESIIVSSTEAPKAIKEKRAKALKEYDYIYTGKNEDILDFNINFNNAFFQLVMSDLNAGNTKPGNSTKGTEEKEEPALTENSSETNNEQGPSVGLDSRLSRVIPKGTTLSPEQEVKRRLAEQFHDRLINSEVDMITADLEIWGDPFYIPLDTGNNKEEKAGIASTQKGSIDPSNREIICAINFLTPLDYPATRGMFVMNFPELVRPFSGLFRVLAVTNNFSNGRFTQKLKLVRYTNQTDKETGTQGPTADTVKAGEKQKSVQGGRGNGAAEVQARKERAEEIRKQAEAQAATEAQFNDQTQIGGA